MPNEEEDSNNSTQNPSETQNDSTQEDPFAISSDSSDSDSDSDSESDSDEPLPEPDKNGAFYTRPGDFEDIPEDDNSEEANIKRFSRILGSRWFRKTLDEDDRRRVNPEDLFNFPEDKEQWREEDLQELWADAPFTMTKPGWDPALVDEDDVEAIKDEIKAGRDPPIAPFYLPYRKPYPVIPDNNHDISNPKAVVEELDRIEEFLRWVSFVFQDGSTYEGTVWDDLAHGKGVYVTEQCLVRYEGEWLQNNMEGHGVVEVDIPDIEPIPGSKLEEEMRAEGKIIKRDFMRPEDREWLEMDIEDSVNLHQGSYEIPFYENDEWIRQYGRKPEKGRYRYAGQWKHSRMHGCGVYELNDKIIYGRFYFGELLEDSTGCDEETSALHSGIAEVAAAKARMFVNKPDGMVREERGPYNDPQHHYFYEEEDVWQAPGFINQFYEVPDYWKTYVHEVDQEREMWLNSFYRAPLRLPMPAELEYWWEKDEMPEFVLINKEPEPDPEDPTKLIYTEDPLILHTPSGRIINYIEDEEHGLRLFWQPPLKEGEDVDPTKVEFLPLGFDEFYGREEVDEEKSLWDRVVTTVESKIKPIHDGLVQWAEEQKKASDMRLELLEKELELVEAELSLQEEIEDMEEELKREEKEANKKVEMGLPEEDDNVSTSASTPATGKDERTSPEEQEEDGEEEEEEEEEDAAPTSFGSVGGTDYNRKGDQKGNGSGKSPFSTLSFTSAGLISMVPSMLQQSFTSWRLLQSSRVHLCNGVPNSTKTINAVSFQRVHPPNARLRVATQADWKISARHCSKRRACMTNVTSRTSVPSLDQMHCRQPLKEPSRHGRQSWLRGKPETDSDIILSLSIPIHLDQYVE